MEESQILAAAAKLPLDERVAHTNWKVRSAAYEAIKAGCDNVFSADDPVLSEYGETSWQCCSTCTAAARQPDGAPCSSVHTNVALSPSIRVTDAWCGLLMNNCCIFAAGLFAKATSDGNAAALDKALEALQVFLAKVPDSTAARISGSVSSNLVKKTCGARPSTASKGIDCLIGLVEVQQAEKIMASTQRGC